MMFYIVMHTVLGSFASLPIRSVLSLDLSINYLPNHILSCLLDSFHCNECHYFLGCKEVVSSVQYNHISFRPTKDLHLKIGRCWSHSRGFWPGSKSEIAISVLSVISDNETSFKKILTKDFHSIIEVWKVSHLRR